MRLTSFIPWFRFAQGAAVIFFVMKKFTASRFRFQESRSVRFAAADPFSNLLVSAAFLFVLLAGADILLAATKKPGAKPVYKTTHIEKQVNR